METNGNGTGGPAPGAWGFRGARPPGLASWRRLSAKAAYCRRANQNSRPSAHNQRKRNRRTGTGCVGVPGGSAPRASIVATPFGEGGLLPASKPDQQTLSPQPTETEPEDRYRVRGGSGGLGPPG